MSNMLYACSILYKTKLPFILVFNKTDAQSHEFALEWMQDFEVFQEALQKRDREGRDGEPSYMNGLMNSMSLVLDEFYKNLRVSSCGILNEGNEETRRGCCWFERREGRACLLTSRLPFSSR